MSYEEFDENYDSWFYMNKANLYSEFCSEIATDEFNEYCKEMYVEEQEY